MERLDSLGGEIQGRAQFRANGRIGGLDLSRNTLIQQREVMRKITERIKVSIR